MRPSASQVAIDAWIRALEETEGNGAPIRKYRFLKKKEVYFLAWLLLCLLLLFGFGVYRAVHARLFDSTLSCIATGCIIAFCVYFGVLGVLAERPSDLHGCLGSYILLCLLQTWFVNAGDHDDSILVIVVTCTVWFAGIFLCWFVHGLSASYRGSSNYLLRIVQDRTTFMQPTKCVLRFKSLLVFDFEMSLVICIDLCYPDVMGFWLRSTIVLVGTGIPIAVIYLITGIYLIRTEKLFAFWILIILGIFLPGCVIQIVVTMVLMANWNFVGNTTTIVGINLSAALVALLIRIALYCSLCNLKKNFGKGVNTQMYRKKVASSRHGSLRSTEGQQDLPNYSTMDGN